MYYKSRQNRMNEIWNCVEEMSDRGGASRLDIARALQLGKSPHLIDIINQMVAEGHIVEIQEVNPNKPSRLLYYVNRDN